MFSIMDAVEAAQKRAEERDVENAARRARLLVPETQEIMPIKPITTGSDGGGGGIAPDLRTDAEKYADAVKINQSFVVGLPVIGSAIGLMNDRFISEYEKENPDARKSVSGQRYTKLGRLLGFGDPGTTGLGGFFGSDSSLYNAGFQDLASGGIGYAGAPMEIGGGMIGGVGGGEYSGRADYGQTEATGGTYGERDEDGNVSASTF